MQRGDKPQRTFVWSFWFIPMSLCGFVALVSVMDVAWPGFIGGTLVWSEGNRVWGTWGSILMTAGFAGIAYRRNLRGGYVVTKRYLMSNYNQSDVFRGSPWPVGWTRWTVVVVGWTATFSLACILAGGVVGRLLLAMAPPSDDQEASWVYQAGSDVLLLVALTLVAGAVFYRTYCATWGNHRWGWNEWTQRGKRLVVGVVKVSPWWGLGYLVARWVT